ncbi:flavin reductase family protein [Arthrobacter sp. Sr24]
MTVQAETVETQRIVADVPVAGLMESSLTDSFKVAFGGHPAGVSIITADSATGPVGITASSVASVSADPPLLAFSLAASNGSAAALALADSVVVHLLTTDDLELAKTFANSKSERFSSTMLWARLETGEPLLVHGGYALRCKILSRTPAGGSLLLAAQVLEIMPPDRSGSSDKSAQRNPAQANSSRMNAGAPMVYHGRNFHAIGEHSVMPH